METNYAAKPVTELRKMAQGKIKNVKGMRKADLVKALAEFDVKQAARDSAALDEVIRLQADEDATESNATPTKPKTQPMPQAKPRKARTGHESDAKAQLRKDGRENRDAFRKAVSDAKTSKGKCEVCGVRRIDRKTQGRDSTMCGPCFEYAGWENIHSDNGHEAILDKDVRTGDELDEIQDCPVCQGNDPADKPARKNGSKPGRKVAKPVKTSGGQTKAQKFAADAKAAGWKPRIETVENGHLEIVTATHPNTGEWLRIQWRDGACLNTGTTHKRPDGKTVKVRNASAARKVLVSD